MANAMPGDFLAVATAGAYASCCRRIQFRPRAPEVLVEGAQWRIVRQRETFDDLVRGETVDASRYTCYRAAGPVAIDGNLDKPRGGSRPSPPRS